ncbi:hypothetical protein HCN44_010495 [Aphidius gifuensis]|uniref:Sodium/potassium-transporting ATPase subunit beta-1-interacting protein n=1 Tax=Aphidius gifuensis TaxID=684658 RepID=A0A835CPB7_APHGI|nr:protein PIEZO homolog isoform X1 [Aphidius gifuensis]KAF7991694.1 hypothetical protein HCN44_010495 [Aphidius gifuensis]
MGFCSKRHFLLTICTLQLITTIERQVFDFLGFMWLPILFNFFNIIFIILGFFGAFQYRPKYLITYCLWDVLWLGWNIFLICFYLEVGGLNKMSDILNFGTGSFSWWQENGPGCNAAYDVTEPGFLVRPTNVTNCVLNYEVIEIIHASTQCILVLMAIIGGIFLTRAFMEEDDSSQIKKRKKQQRPLYSIEYSIRPEPQIQDDSVSPKPMTPRRVKRRSVISRDGTRRSSRRSSVRQSSRRKNPVNRIMEHQENLYANTMPTLLINQNVNSLSQGVLNYDRIAVTWDRDRNTNNNDNNNHNNNSNNNINSNNNNNWPPPPEPLHLASSVPTIWTPEPGYSNIQNYQSQPTTPPWELNANNSTRNLTDNWQNNNDNLNPMQWQGQANPTFQQTSTQTLNGEDMEDLYGNRPASARSSYSNYHGIRIPPQIPNRTADIIRQSQRQFVLSGGPPAYQDTVI